MGDKSRCSACGDFCAVCSNAWCTLPGVPPQRACHLRRLFRAADGSENPRRRGDRNPARVCRAWAHNCIANHGLFASTRNDVQLADVSALSNPVRISHFCGRRIGAAGGRDLLSRTTAEFSSESNAALAGGVCERGNFRADPYPICTSSRLERMGFDRASLVGRQPECRYLFADTLALDTGDDARLLQCKLDVFCLCRGLGHHHPRHLNQRMGSTVESKMRNSPHS